MVNGFNGIFYYLLWWIALAIMKIIAVCYIEDIVGNNIVKSL